MPVGMETIVCRCITATELVGEDEMVTCMHVLLA